MATVIAELTNEARKAIARMSVEGQSFIIEDFEAGKGGHDPALTAAALTPDVSITGTPLKTFGPKAVTSKQLIDIFTAEVIITLSKSEAVGELSNIVLFARVNSSPIPSDPLIGTRFPFAIGNMPLQNKLAGEERIFNLILNY